MKPSPSLIWRIGIVALVVGSAACAPPNPGLERFEQGEWIELGPVVVESLSGRRTGADVEATGVFTREQDRITLSMAFVLGPPARLVEGSHRSRIGGQAFEGAVSEESVTFLGGQNAAPSLGGVFLFANPDDGHRYRLRFPPTPVT